MSGGNVVSIKSAAKKKVGKRKALLMPTAEDYARALNAAVELSWSHPRAAMTRFNKLRHPHDLSALTGAAGLAITARMAEKARIAGLLEFTRESRSGDLSIIPDGVAGD